jgi:hypothetical protein
MIMQWGRIASGIWSGIEAFGAELIAVSDSGNINKYDTSTNSFIEFSTLPESVLDIRALGII